MEQSPLNWIASFIWGIAGAVRRDRYVQGKQIATHRYGQRLSLANILSKLRHDTQPGSQIAMICNGVFSL